MSKVDELTSDQKIIEEAWAEYMRNTGRPTTSSLAIEQMLEALKKEHGRKIYARDVRDALEKLSRDALLLRLVVIDESGKSLLMREVESRRALSKSKKNERG
jgi:hypothetical protein